MRNYKSEYAAYHSRPEQIANRSSRNKARRKMVAAGKAKPGDGKDVDHRDGDPQIICRPLPALCFSQQGIDPGWQSDGGRDRNRNGVRGDALQVRSCYPPSVGLCTSAAALGGRGAGATAGPWGNGRKASEVCISPVIEILIRA
jgi:hypothetical protein